MESGSKGSRIILALQALERDLKLSIRAAAVLYKIPYTTLYSRRDGRATRNDTTPNSRKLSKPEEEVLVEYILKLDSRGYSPNLGTVGDMADQLLAIRDTRRIGKH